MFDIKEVGDELISVVKTYTGSQVEPVIKRLDELCEKVAALPTPENGKDADPELVKQLVKEAVAEIPVPENGSNGEDGRDALDLDVMQSIDEARRYRRNSYASHKGGLWKTIRTSEGMDGWECIVDGIDAVHIEMSDDRTISIKTVLSSGRVEQKAFSLPVVLDRGVYAAEKSYSQGDGVTYGGCYWIAQKDAPEGVPGASDDFRLAVKKGRDGRDLRENASKHDPSKGVRI